MRFSKPTLWPLFAIWFAVAFSLTGAFTGNRSAVAQTEDVSGFINQNCLDCHNAAEKSGGLDLGDLPVSFESLESRNMWIRIYDRVHSSEMPPESKLTAAQREPFTDALRTALVAEISSQQQREGRTVLRRLNRREFENSLWNVDSVKDWKVPGMAIEWIEIEGPLLDQWPPAGVAGMFGEDAIRKLENRGRWTNQGHIGFELAPEDPQASATAALTQFATRAFRRPLADGEADRFVQLAHTELDRGRSYEQAMRVALRGILISPRFLMLDESPGMLDDYALASRLSFLFWSNPPDDELLQVASAGQLSNARVLHQQVDRLLAAPRAAQFVSSFVGQWLDLNQIDATVPDTKLYPEYDDLLRSSMVLETQAYFREMLTQNLPIANLISSDFAMLDGRMAEHYDLSGSFLDSKGERHDEEFRRVSLPADSVRGGVMTQAAILKVTANGTVTSPVLRGAWILRRIIGKPPSPPPPVNAIEPDTRGATTIRQQLAKHRDSHTCNRCHREIDPPGFALESFDVIGGFRERYRSVGDGDAPSEKLHGRNIWEYKLGQPVDCTGQTADGKPFTDIRDFKRLMLMEEEQIVRCLTEKLITYATGSGIGFTDRDEVAQIVTKVRSQDSGLRTLIHEVVASELFLKK